MQVHVKVQDQNSGHQQHLKVHFIVINHKLDNLLLFRKVKMAKDQVDMENHSQFLILKGFQLQELLLNILVIKIMSH